MMRGMRVRRRKRTASGHSTPGIRSSIPSNLLRKIILIEDSDAEDEQVRQQDPFARRSGVKYIFGRYLFHLMDRLMLARHSSRRYLILAIAFQYPPQCIHTGDYLTDLTSIYNVPPSVKMSWGLTCQNGSPHGFQAVFKSWDLSSRDSSGVNALLTCINLRHV